MYKVMIVDDEPIILEKLRCIIDWGSYGCEIIAETNDSTEALKLASELKPHIIYSDIYMPLMTGLELAEALKRELPQSVIVLISGYDDFNYAQQAIETGVFRYLLKPIHTQTFIKVLQEAEQYLNFLEQEVKEKENLKAQIKNSLPYLREKFFYDLLNGEINQELLHQQLSFLGLSSSCVLYGAITIHLDNYTSLATSLKEDELQLNRVHLLNRFQYSLKERITLLSGFQRKPGEFVMIYGMNQDQSQEGLIQGIQEVQTSMEETYGITISAGLGRLYPDYNSLRTSYHEALLALDFKLWAGKRVIIPYSDIENTKAGHLFFHPDYDGFMAILREGNLEKAFEFIQLLFTSFKSTEYTSKSFLHLTMLGLVNQIIHSLMEFNISFKDVFGKDFDPLMDINSPETLSDLEVWLQNLSRKAIIYIQQHKQDVSKDFVEKAKIYIETNYINPDLNLARVAENVFVSPCYLSHLFKEITGNTVIEYLTKMRIRAAKKLLKTTQLKIYEIAEQIGFNDYHYFGIVFKKSTGLAPLEYREKVQFDNLI